MKKIFLVILAALSLLALTACSQKDNPAETRIIATKKLLKKGKIKIAITGQWSSQNGIFIWQGAKLAADEINKAGGVLGAQIELLRFEDNNKVSQGAEVAGKITEDQEICAVIGHYSSSVSLFNSALYHYYGILMLTPFSTNTTLTKQGLPYVLRNIPDNNMFAREAVRFCERQNWNRVMALYLNNYYCRELLDSFEQYCGERGVIVPDRVGYEDVYSLKNYTEIATKWKNNYEFDAIFIAGFLPQAAEIVSIFRSEGINCPIIGSIDFDAPIFFSVGDCKNENNFYCVSNYDPNSKYKPFREFKDAFIAEYKGEPNWEACQAYDAVKVLSTAIQKAGSVQPDAVADALKSEKQWNEAAGPYRFNKNGEIGKLLFFKKSEGGEFKIFEEQK